jgi:hypothetical protein
MVKAVAPVIVQDADKPVEKAVLAQAIVDISRGVQRLEKGGFGRETVAILVHHHSKIPLRDVRLVLDHLSWLAENVRK